VAFSDDTRERVRNANDIVDVIGSYLPLKRAGANFVALCPFHKEKTPSFNVNPHRQIFHCFGCQKGGDVFTFVMEYDSVDFPEALRRLADRAKIPLEFEKGSGGEKTRHVKEQLLQIHDQIAQRWQNALANEASGQIARDYLAKRGVSAEAIKLFRLGYAPDLWDDTVNWAKSKDYDLLLVEKGGLILKREQGDGYYDRFRGRLMFPICDEQGRVIAFSGRILSGDEKTAKYVNSPETPIFIKSKVFFGLDKAKRAILDAGHAIICEGQLDMIACFMSGIQNIVAPQGTAFTADHARIIKRFVDEVVLCFDSDAAGQNAAVRALDSLLASGLAIRVVTVPAPHDPDSFIKANGGAAFRQLIERAEGFFDYYLGRLCATRETATDKGRLAIWRAMAEALHKTGNVLLVDTYARKTAWRLGVTPDAGKAEIKKWAARRHVVSNEPDEGVPKRIQTVRPNADEFALLQLLFQHEDLVEFATAHLHPDWIPHLKVRRIVTERLAAMSADNWRGLPYLMEFLGDSESQSLLTEATARNYREGASGEDPVKDVRDHLRGRVLPNPLEDLRGIIKCLRDAYIASEISRLNSESALQDRTPQQVETLRKIMSLESLKRQPITPLTTPQSASSGLSALENSPEITNDSSN
jgi:DNA primase